jgi:hypothetical protein
MAEKLDESLVISVRDGRRVHLIDRLLVVDRRF